MGIDLQQRESNERGYLNTIHTVIIHSNINNREHSEITNEISFKMTKEAPKKNVLQGKIQSCWWNYKLQELT